MADQHPRIQVLADVEPGPGTCVLYWCQAALRSRWNHALEYAISRANRAGVPVLAVFCLSPGYPGATWRAYDFLLRGLAELLPALEERGITARVALSDPAECIPALASLATEVVTDRGYLRIQAEWRATVARTCGRRLTQVEAEVVVPVGLVSEKEEYAAATIRGKIHRHLDAAATELQHQEVHNTVPPDLSQVRVRLVDATRLRDAADQHVRADRSVTTVGLAAGERAATAAFEDFVAQRLPAYSELRSDPALGWDSGMSPYLHFGMISPVYLYRRVSQLREDRDWQEAARGIRHGLAGNEGGGPRARIDRNASANDSIDAYIEELVVRRELAVNFVTYNPGYDSFGAIPGWARDTLAEHAGDTRDPRYLPEQLEAALTGDPAWNAAQRQMLESGKMHNYMRMYWGKKVIEWMPDPEAAFTWLVEQNDRYELDGRDPNGYTGVAWCFGKHDRPWTERPVFGKVRYMNAAGLKRKFAIERYIRRWSERAGHTIAE